MSDPQLYTIGWICAIATEYTAACQFLDTEHSLPTHLAPNDSNGYTLGEMAGHNVVIAVLPRGEYGLSSAASVAANMLNSFPNIRVGLMVGIGGGAPTSKNDIRLGDIVVSSPKDQTGGVYQYDFGKTIQGRKFQPTAFLNQPPAVVLTAISVLESKYEAEGHHIEEDIAAVFKRRPKLTKKYSRPNQLSDRLYRSHVIHPQDDEGVCEELCGTEANDLVRRDIREDGEDDPAIHYGIIASANQLMKDATIRDALAKEKGILCFEMEAAGLMNRFPCLVVRGICDYSDSHKNKGWQGYAAMTAAAYTKDLLARMVPSQVEREQKIHEALSRICQMVLPNRDGGSDHCLVMEDVGVIHDIVQDTHDSLRVSQMKNWLSPSDPSINHQQALDLRHEGTGLWLLEDDVYKLWKTRPSSFLWLHAFAGAGKTVLSATIIEDLQRDCVISGNIVYFYFTFSDEHKQSLQDMVSSLVSQIYSIHKETRQPLDALYQSHKEGDRQPSLDSLSRTLNEMISQMDEVTIVLEALDESRTRNELLLWLKGIRETQDINLRLLATSRKEEDIYSHIGKWCSTDEMLAIPHDAMDRDIQAYVHTSIQTDRRFDRWEFRPDVQEEIETKLMEKAGGMFRWAKCQLDTLEHCFDYADVEKTLRELPKDLYGTYARILEQIREQNVPKVVKVLQLLTWSERPLLLEEMVDAIAVRPNDEPAFHPTNRMPRPRDILRICPSLVVLVEKSASEESILEHVTYDSQGSDKGRHSGAAKVWELRLAHFSVKEYLVSKDIQHPLMRQLEETSARAAIATTCLAYLSSLDHNLSPGQIRKQHAFSQYSAIHWAENASICGGTDKGLQSRITAFFNEAEIAFMTCCALFNPDYPWITEPDPTLGKVLTPLYYASMTGLEMSTKSLIRKGADVNAQGGRYGSALQAASVRGHDKIVQMLLAKGADVNAQSGRYGSALQAASAGGYDKIVQILLDKGAD
ncbi:hypothetical protein D6D28_10596, partial [Aureobasidium pullulans]